MLRDVWREAMAKGGWAELIRALVALILVFLAILATGYAGEGMVR
jgi:hypothetical protein